MTDYVLARENMIESQVRPNGVTDPRIIAVLQRLKREEFVPDGRRAVAYADRDIEIAPGRYLMTAMAMAKLVQAADIAPGDRVLQVGAGSGYGTAVLAALAGSLVALENNAELLLRCRDVAASLGNVRVVDGPLEAGWPQAAPFDAIVVEGKVGDVPVGLLEQLADGGRLVAVTGDGAAGKAHVWTSHGGKSAMTTAFDAAAAALPGFAKKRPAFVF